MEIIKKYEVKTFEDIIKLQDRERVKLEELEVVAIISEEYNINKDVVSKIYDYAYQEKHGSGLGEVYNEMIGLLDLVEDILKIDRGGK